MAVENHEGGTMITDEHISVAQAFARVGALSLSIRLGGRPGLMATMAEQCGSSKRTKKGVLEDYVVWLYANGLALDSLWGTVDRALGAERALKLKRRVIK